VILAFIDVETNLTVLAFICLAKVGLLGYYRASLPNLLVLVDLSTFWFILERYLQSSLLN